MMCGAQRGKDALNSAFLTAITDVARPLKHHEGTKRTIQDAGIEAKSFLDLPVRKRRLVKSPSPESKLCKNETRVDVDGRVMQSWSTFAEFWETYLTQLEHHGIERACEIAEEMADARYDELCCLLESLLDSSAHDVLPCGKVGDCDYDVLQFAGQQLPHHLLERCHPDTEMEDKLEHSRNQSVVGKSRDAICALLACLASRPEKAWLESLDTDYEMKAQLKAEPGQSRQQAFSVVLKYLAAKKVHGYFAHALVSPNSIMRVSLSHDGARLRPASLTVTYSCTLRQAFAQMDDDGPLPKSILGSQGQEFALQSLLPGNGSLTRQSIKLLEPEPKLCHVLSSPIQVVMLDAIAALAPRARAKQHNLSAIVKSELGALLADAKAQGKAVVFMLGGDSPHILAEKVYLRAPFTDHGLRCGYIRWRKSAADPWARERSEDKRVCIGLQLP